MNSCPQAAQIAAIRPAFPRIRTQAGGKRAEDRTEKSAVEQRHECAKLITQHFAGIPTEFLLKRPARVISRPLRLVGDC